MEIDPELIKMADELAAKITAGEINPLPAE
jgi:hypothetical protein